MKIRLFPPQAIQEMGARSNQEDSMFPEKGTATASDRLFLVCDGMGGHAKGEVASRTVAETISTFLNQRLDPSTGILTDELLAQAIEAAFVALDERDDGSYKKMGTTLTLVSFHKGGATVAHIGDSRIYHLRPATGEILYKSRDHSLVYELYQSREITYGEMKTSPQKNVITRAMMPGEDNRTHADIAHITDIKAGDYFYHCSDGMLEEMEDEELLSIISSSVSDAVKAQQLIDATVNNKDNHTAYLLHIAQVDAEPGDENMPDNEATANCNAIRIERELGKDDVQIVEPEQPQTQQPSTVANNQQPPQAPPAPIAPQPQTPRVITATPATPGQLPPQQPKAKKAKKSILPTMLVIIFISAIIGGSLWYFRDQIFNSSKNGTGIVQPSIPGADAESEAIPAQPSDKPLNIIAEESKEGDREAEKRKEGKRGDQKDNTPDNKNNNTTQTPGPKTGNAATDNTKKNNDDSKQTESPTVSPPSENNGGKVNTPDPGTSTNHKPNTVGRS